MLASETPGLIKYTYVYNNVVYNNHAAGEPTDPEKQRQAFNIATVNGYSVELDDVYVYNNTFQGGNIVFRLNLPTTKVTKLVFKNNILHGGYASGSPPTNRFIHLQDGHPDDDQWSEDDYDDLAHAGNLSIDNNLFTAVLTTDYAWMHGTGEHENMDADFVDADGGDFRLGSDSAARDLVSDGDLTHGIYNWLIPTDAPEISRSGSTYDIGAFEYYAE